MTTTTRAAFAACLFTAIVAGTIAPQLANAHAELTEGEKAGTTRTHGPQAPENFRVQRLASSPHNTIVVSWDEPHFHTQLPRYRTAMEHYEIVVSNRDMNPHDDGNPPHNCHPLRSSSLQPTDCIRRTVTPTTGRHSATFTGLLPGTSYSVGMNAFSRGPGGVQPVGNTTYESAMIAAITTASAPRTPEAQTCTYEHRLIGVPGASAYSGRILISSKAPNATATIRAYQSDNGHRIDVLDADGRDVETVSLDPANSVKRFTIEAAQGWHPVTVTHPSESAMQAATVAMRFRDGGSLKDRYPPGIEHCEPTSTGPVTTTDTPTEPETPSPPEPETPAPPEPETPDPVTPEPEPETPEPPAPAAAELAVTLTGAVRDAGKVAVSGTVTNAGTTASAPTRIRFLNGRRRVHTATVPAIGGGGVHAIRADVAMPDGDAVQVCIVPKGRDADPSNDCDTASVTTGQ